MIPISVYLLLLAQLLYISYVDIKTRKISNLWPLLNYLIFFVLLYIYPEQYKISWEVFIYPTVFIFVCFALFVLKIMGAGDTKYLSSLFVLVPLLNQDVVFINLAYATLFVGVVLFLYNTINNFNKIKSAIILRNVHLVKSVYGKNKFAYTPVICISWLLFGIWIWRNS